MAKWYKLDRNFNRVAGPFSPGQVQRMLKTGELKKSTEMQCEDGYCTTADCVRTIDYIDNDYKFLSHRQRAYLRFLGYTGSMYISQDDCTYAIERLKTLNPNGVDGLDFERLAAEETARGDKFFEEAYEWVSRRGYAKLPRELRPKEFSLVFATISLPFKLAWLLTRGGLKLLGFAGKGAAMAGRGALAAGQKGAELAKDAATRAAEFERENKVLQGAAARIAAGAKKGAAAVADSLCIEQEPQQHPMRTWTSADGRETIQARLVAVSPTAIRLQKEDGSLVDISRANLSAADQASIPS